MLQTYQQLKEGQFIMTFADLEGDLPFLQRSLALYKERYKSLYPKAPLTDDDFTIAGYDTDKPYIKFPDNVICVNIGDLTDKTRSSDPNRKECYNLKLVDILSNTHNQYRERMVSILGNRETTKFRLQNELNNDYINHVLEQELSLLADARKLTADKRRPDFVWVDGPAKTFLTSLKIAMLTEAKTITNENDLKVQNKLNLDDQRLKDISDEKVREFFQEKQEEEQQIIYAKWMLANSCGAADLWNDIATEARTKNDSETLAVFKKYFSEADGAYVNYLRHCQIGAQIGATLFTHGGLEDSSFNMPKTLLTILTAEQIKAIFGPDASADNLPQKNGRVVANSALQMLSALNTWYAVLMDYRFSDEAEKNENLEKAVAELLDMGLPRERHEGASLINIEINDKDGAYGNPITAETHAKLIHNQGAEPIYLAYQGHKPAEIQRVGTVFNQVDGKEVLLHRLAGDTCNYRQEKAAVALIINLNNNHTVVSATAVGRTPESKPTFYYVTSRSASGALESPNGTPLSKEGFPYFGRQVKFSEEAADKGWNIVNFNDSDKTFALYKQDGFTPRHKTVAAGEIYRLLDVKNEQPKPIEERKLLGQQLVEAAQRAQARYAAHYQDNKQYSRGANGFFSWLRHGKTGQANALKFIKDIEHDGNVGEHLKALLESPSTRYHRHSFSSYLLDELGTAFIAVTKDESLQKSQFKNHFEFSKDNIYDKDKCLAFLEQVRLFDITNDSNKTNAL